MKKIASFTVAALAAKADDPFFAGLSATMDPIYADYIEDYDTWQSQRGLQTGQTDSVDHLLLKLSQEKIKGWDVAIQNVYPTGTSEYKALLPHHRIPFQRGTQLDRIGAVNALAKSIGTDATLQTVKTDVLAFHTKLKKAYKAQKGSISTTGTSSKKVEAQRLKMGTELFGALGKIMDHCKDNPSEIVNYFDVETIQNREQTVYTGKIKGGELLLALIHTFAVGDNVNVINRGNTDLKVALLEEKNGTITTVFVTVVANSHKTILGSDLGNIATNRYLKILNMSATEAGAYTVELV